MSGGASLWDTSTNPPSRLDSATGAWQLSTYTWAFPSGAVKGYGKFTQNNDDPSGPYYTFAGDPDPETNSPTYARLDPFTADDLTLASPTTEPNDHVFNSFYWGPAATGTQTVSITATFVNTATMATFTGSDSATFNVVAPTGSITTTSAGTAGTSTVRADGNQWIQMDVNAPRPSTGPPVGIAWQAYVTPSIAPIGAIGGQFAVTQTMTYFGERRYYGLGGYGSTLYTEDDGLVMPGKTSPGVILDKLHYPNSNGSGVIGVGYVSPGKPATLSSNDTPGTPLLPGYFDYARQDFFTMTLMYEPPGGIWVPVGSLAWDWFAVANASGSAYMAGSSNQHFGTYSPTTAFPTWSYSFAGLSNNWQQTSP